MEQKNQNPSLEDNSPARRGKRGPAPKPTLVDLNKMLLADRVRVRGHVRLIDTMTKRLTKARPMIISIRASSATLCGDMTYELSVYVPKALQKELSPTEHGLEIGQPIEVVCQRKMDKHGYSTYMLESFKKISVSECEAKVTLGSKSPLQPPP